MFDRQVRKQIPDVETFLKNEYTPKKVKVFKEEEKKKIKSMTWNFLFRVW